MAKMGSLRNHHWFSKESSIQIILENIFHVRLFFLLFICSFAHLFILVQQKVYVDVKGW